MIDPALLSLFLAGSPAVPAVPAAPLDDLQTRPFGNVMGDGLNLQSMPEPVGGAVCAPGETLFGIDVSYYQGTINWPSVAASGVQFSIVRVSHSTQFFDPQFQANLDGSRAAGIHTGVYQFFEPDEDPIAQADLLLDAMGPLMPGDLPPMIDVESTGGQSPAAIANAVQAWLDHVEAALGVKPLIYTGYYFWQDNVGSAAFGEYPLVLPWYGVQCPGGVPAGWDMWTIHQYCDCGNVGGISGAVDVDTFNGSLAELEALASVGECGDALCTGTETPYTCAMDCPPCGVVSPEGGVIDNGEECYRLYGSGEYWRQEPAGEGGSLVWTHTTDYAEASNYAIWQLHFAESGLYDLEVRITQPFGESHQAGYVVRHAGGESVVPIDQSAQDGWVSLGEFMFDAATDHTLRLDDNTGEPVDGEVMLVYDAVRLTRLDGAEPTTGDPSGGSDDGPSDDTGGASGDDDDDAGGTTGSQGEPTTGFDTDNPGARGGDDSGCGCRTRGGTPGSGVAGLVGLLLLGLRRRRRR